MKCAPVGLSKSASRLEPPVARKSAQHSDSRLIDSLGGAAVLADALGFDTRAGGVQRVHNWRTRGIPGAVKWRHCELFSAALEQAGATTPIAPATTP